MPLPEAGSSSTTTSSASSAPSSSSSSSASSCAAELWRADGQELRPASPRRRPPPLLPSPSLNAPSPQSMATLYRTSTTPLDAEHDLGHLAAKLGDSLGAGNDVGLLPAQLGDGENDLFLAAGKVGGAFGRNASAAAPTSGKVLPSIALSAQASAGRGASRVSKRRSRASNKPPITVLSADTSNFRAMVQKLTGVPASAAGLPPPPFPPTNNGFPLHHHTLWGGAASPLPPSLLMKAQLPPGMPTIDTSSPFLPFLGPCQHPAAAAAAAAASHFMHPGVKAPAFPNNGGSSPYGAAMANLKSLLMSSSAGSFGSLPASGTSSSLGDSIANAASSSSSSPLSSTFGYTSSGGSTAAPPSACGSMAKLWDLAEGADRWARGSTLTSMVSDGNADACERRQQQFQQQQQPQCHPLPPDLTLAGHGHVSNTLSEQALNLESLLMEDDSLSPHKAYPWLSCDGPSLINSSSSLAPSKMEMAKLT